MKKLLELYEKDRLNVAVFTRKTVDTTCQVSHFSMILFKKAI